MLLSTAVHERRNPLTGQLVIVSPHRGNRPWDTPDRPLETSSLPEYDQECPLCPGNTRKASGIITENYTGTTSFTNDSSAFLPPPILGEDVAPELPQAPSIIIPGIMQERPVSGTCRVVCFSPKHNQTLSEMSVAEIYNVLQKWKQEYSDLGSLPYINYVQEFENKGALVGCSQPHPHGQIWASDFIPEKAKKIYDSQLEYLRNEEGRPFHRDRHEMLMVYLEHELQLQDRVVIGDNDSWVALVPHWAYFPFETMVIPREPAQSILDLNEKQMSDWAQMHKDLLSIYDNIFKTSFPYMMGIYQKPTDGRDYTGSVMHQVFCPPLLRSATTPKFTAGYEVIAEYQRDITAEYAAAVLRSQSRTHYKEQ